MVRFQRALKDHLEKQNEKVTLEYKELVSIGQFYLSSSVPDESVNYK